MDSALQAISFTFAIFYGSTLIIDELVLTTMLWDIKYGIPNHIRRTTAVVIGIGIVSLIFWMVTISLSGSPKYEELVCIGTAIDILYVCNTLMIGESLTHESKFGVKDMIVKMVPFIVILIFIIFFPNDMCLHLSIVLAIAYICVRVPIQWKKISKHDKDLVNEYSEINSRRQLWYKRITVILGIQIIFLVLPSLLSKTSFMTKTAVIVCYWIYDLMGAIIWLSVVHCLIHMKPSERHGLYPVSNIENYAEVRPEKRDSSKKGVPAVKNCGASDFSPHSDNSAGGKVAIDSAPIEDESREIGDMVEADEKEITDLDGTRFGKYEGNEGEDSGEDEKSGEVEGNYPASWIARLEKSIFEDKAYLQPDLTINKLAQIIGTNRSYLSDYLNNILKTNYHDFINGLRMEDVDKLLKDESLTMIEIANQCGFSDVRTFRKMFKAKYGCLPSHYRKRSFVSFLK